MATAAKVNKLCPRCSHTRTTLWVELPVLLPNTHIPSKQERAQYSNSPSVAVVAKGTEAQEKKCACVCVRTCVCETLPVDTQAAELPRASQQHWGLDGPHYDWLALLPHI